MKRWMANERISASIFFLTLDVFSGSTPLPFFLICLHLFSHLLTITISRSFLDSISCLVSFIKDSSALWPITIDFMSECKWKATAFHSISQIKWHHKKLRWLNWLLLLIVIRGEKNESYCMWILIFYNSMFHCQSNKVKTKVGIQQ